VLVLSILIVLLMLRPTGLADRERSEDLSDVPALEGIAGGRRPSGPWPRRLFWGLLVLALVYPPLDRALGLHQEVVFTGILIFALLALGLNILLGFAGLLDLGYAAIFGIGGYTTGLLTVPSGRFSGIVPGDFLIVLALSIAAAGLFGILNGALTLRLRGDYLAIVTLAFGQAVPRIFLNVDELTGGASGMTALPPPRILGHTLASATERYYLVLALVVLAAFVSLRVVRSRLGRAWAALSEDETAAMSSGISVARARPLAFGLGAIMAGVAGALYASIFSYVEPEQSEFRLSAMALAMVVIGGVGSVRGAVVGALVIGGYNYVIIPVLGAWLYQQGQTSGGWLLAASTLRELTYLTFGLALYLTVLARARQASR
jgi:branched-chain amino acid transport system permease protein